MNEIENKIRQIKKIYDNRKSFFNLYNEKSFKYLIVNYNIELPFLLYKICNGELSLIKICKHNPKTLMNFLDLYNNHISLKTNTLRKAMNVSKDINLIKNYLYDINSILSYKINNNEKLDEKILKNFLELSNMIEYNYTNNINEYLNFYEKDKKKSFIKRI